MIKKCPFCGERKYIEWLAFERELMEIVYVMQCLTCNAKGPPAKSRIHATLLWNERKH